MKRKKMPLYIFLALIVVLALYSAGHVFYREKIIEKPKYEVVEQREGYEIREYPEMIIAEVEVKDNSRQGLNDGFMEVADFIFGNNEAGDGPEKIAMTSPVLDERAAGESRKVSFVMPSKWTIDTLPKPKNENVRIYSTDKSNFAAKKIIGSWQQDKLESILEDFKKQLEEEGLELAGVETLAYYDPPSAPFFVRRVDILLELK